MRSKELGADTFWLSNLSIFHIEPALFYSGNLNRCGTGEDTLEAGQTDRIILSGQTEQDCGQISPALHDSEIFQSTTKRYSP